MGTSTDPENDTEAAFAHAEMATLGVDCSTCSILPSGSMPVSYILSSKATGSRTIVHSRDLEELKVSDFEHACDKLVSSRHCKELSSASAASTIAAPDSMWFHFEGRNMESVLQMMHHVRTNAPPASVISVEIEALRYDWELARKLAASADFVFVSKDYIRDKLGFDTAASFMESEFKKLLQADGVSLKAIISPWGAEGVYYLSDLSGDSQSAVRRIPTKRLDHVVESIGAGDSFIGASIAALSKGVPLDASLRLACEVATSKCLHVGLIFPQDVCKQWTNIIQRERSREE